MEHAISNMTNHNCVNVRQPVLKIHMFHESSFFWKQPNGAAETKKTCMDK